MKYSNLIVATETFISVCNGDLVIREGLYRKTIFGNYKDQNTGIVLKPRKFVDHPQKRVLRFPNGAEGEYNLTNKRLFTEDFRLPNNARGSIKEAKLKFKSRYKKYKVIPAGQNKARYEER